MKIWFKIWENTHLLKSETIEDDTEDTRTHKIFHALEEVCLKWDLGKPIWFDANIAEFQRHARTRFGKACRTALQTAACCTGRFCGRLRRRGKFTAGFPQITMSKCMLM